MLKLDRTKAASLVERFHYSGKLPATSLPYVWVQDGEAIATCCFARGVGRWKLPVFELTRHA